MNTTLLPPSSHPHVNDHLPGGGSEQAPQPCVCSLTHPFCDSKPQATILMLLAPTGPRCLCGPRRAGCGPSLWATKPPAHPSIMHTGSLSWPHMTWAQGMKPSLGPSPSLSLFLTGAGDPGHPLGSHVSLWGCCPDGGTQGCWERGSCICHGSCRPIGRDPQQRRKVPGVSAPHWAL